MDPLTHGFRIDPQLCRGCLACMRSCPTHAIRVKEGRASYKPVHCVDCGACLTACPSGAIAATTLCVEDLSKFRYRIAVPSPVLFSQFPAEVTPDHVIEGLLALGFDEVWDFGVEIEMVTRAIREYVSQWKGPYPLISVTCPVVVRLVQVSYPRMVDQLVNIQLPRELAAREAKRACSERLKIPQEEIGVLYITPCQAKVISILEPAEGVESYLDGALGIADVYNPIVAYANMRKDCPATPSGLVRNSTFLSWSSSERLAEVLSDHRCLPVTGLTNVKKVFEDIERGRLRNVEFLALYNCWGGCTGGNLTVANVYVTRSKFQSLIRALPETDPMTDREATHRYPTEKFSLDAPVKPRPILRAGDNLKDRVRMIEAAERVRKRLPGLDCGLCGAPTCRDLARDIGVGEAKRSECVFLARDKMDHLRKIYLRPKLSAGEPRRDLLE